MLYWFYSRGHGGQSDAKEVTPSQGLGSDRATIRMQACAASPEKWVAHSTSFPLRGGCEAPTA